MAQMRGIIPRGGSHPPPRAILLASRPRIVGMRRTRSRRSAPPSGKARYSRSALKWRIRDLQREGFLLQPVASLAWHVICLPNAMAHPTPGSACSGARSNPARCKENNRTGAATCRATAKNKGPGGHLFVDRAGDGSTRLADVEHELQAVGIVGRQAGLGAYMLHNHADIHLREERRGHQVDGRAARPSSPGAICLIAKARRLLHR